MKFFELVDEKYIQPIPKYNQNLEGWENIPIIDNKEELVSLKNISEKIVIQPQYYKNGISGAENDCKIRKNIVGKLIAVANKLPNGYKLLVWDSYRNIETQQSLFDKYYNEFKKNNIFTEEELLEYTKKFVSIPSKEKKRPSPHNTGAAIDLTICDYDNNPIELGTYFDDFRAEAYTRFFEDKLEQGIELTDEEKTILLNRRILCNLFEEEGFLNYPYEIWHKSLGDQMECKIHNKCNAIYGGLQSKY